MRRIIVLLLSKETFKWGERVEYCYANGNDLISFHMKKISKSYKSKNHEYERDR